MRFVAERITKITAEAIQSEDRAILYWWNFQRAISSESNLSVGGVEGKSGRGCRLVRVALLHCRFDADEAGSGSPFSD